MAELKSDLTRIALMAPALASAAMLQTAQDIFEISQQLVPVDTGALKQSGGVDVVSSHEVNIGYGAGLPRYEHGTHGEQSYANAQEFGTMHQPAQPYLIPAFAQAEETFKVRLVEAIEAAVQ